MNVESCNLASLRFLKAFLELFRLTIPNLGCITNLSKDPDTQVSVWF